MHNLKTIIFDFDGVTVNTEDVFAAFDRDLINAELKERGIPHEISFKQARELAGTSGPDKLLKTLLSFKQDISSADLEDYAKKRDKKRENLFADYPVPLGKNIQALLEKLGKKHSAIATNKLKHKLEHDLKLMGHDTLFDVIVTSDPPMKRKPEPDMILHAMKLLNAAPEETAYIGDNPGDMIAALAAKVTPIGFITSGINNAPKRTKALKNSGAALIIDDFAILKKHIAV